MDDSAAGARSTGGELPLAGRVVAVTRPAHQAAALAGPLEELGASVVLMPLQEPADPKDWSHVDHALKAREYYDWFIFTSANAVDRLLAHIGPGGFEIPGEKVVAIGPATAAALRARGIEPVLEPEESNAEGLVELFESIGGEEGRVLIPRAEEGRETLLEGLKAQGYHVTVIGVYRMVPVAPPADAVDRLRRHEIDAVTFTSGGTAKAFFEAVRKAGADPLEILAATCVASIGPVTSAALGRLGRPADAEARQATSGALAEAVAEAIGRQ